VRPTLLGVALGSVAGGLAVWLALGHPRGAPAPADVPAADERAGSGSPVVRLDAATRERLGLEVAVLPAFELPDEVQGYGHLLDPAGLATPFYDREAARAAFEAADREYRRVQTLQRGNANASQRELEAARAALERDRAGLQTAKARLASVWGRPATARGDLGGLVRSLVARDVSVARIDLPLGADLHADPSGARLAAVGDPSAGTVAAKPIGPAPDADPTTQGRGFLLLVERAPWPAGATLAGWLAVPGPARTGVEVPRSALVRHAGRSYAYLQTADDRFARRDVTLDRPTEQGWFVSGGLAAGDRIVVTGAQQLLSAELAGSLGED